MNADLSRRRFLKTSALAAAGLMIVPRQVLGRGYTAPSDQLTLGVIGAGKQSGGLTRNLMQAGFRLLAVSDVDPQKIKRLQQVAKGAKQAGDAAGYGDFRELLAREDVNAVAIITPDHWHAVMAVAAMKAGKDVYCEKPLALTIEEGRAMAQAARKYGRVFQTGSMQRSWRNFRQACELVCNGYLGDIQEIQVSISGPPVPYSLPEEPIKHALDWDRWLGPSPAVAYNHLLAPTVRQEKLFWPKWRDYKEFGGGGMTDWGAHMFDIAQWALGMDESGPVEILPPNGSEVPFLTYRYASGVRMTHQNFGRGWGVRFIGSKGTMDISREYFDPSDARLKDLDVPESGRLYRSSDHYADFVNAIRQRTKPICDVETGHRTATVCTLGNIAYELKRPLRWDPVKEEFAGDAEANRMRGRAFRGEWSIAV